MKLNILHLTPDFNYSDGRSYYVYLLLKYLKRKKHNVFLCTNGGDSYERVNQFEIPVFEIPSLSKKHLFINSVNQLGKIISQNKIDIIHSHHRYYELLANSVKKNKTHTVFTSLSKVSRRYYIEYKSEKIIAVSNSIKQMLIEKFNTDTKKISLIPNFTDSEEVKEVNDFKAYVNKNNEPYTILSVGRFHKEKNYETLLKAVSLLKNKNIKVILIGEGDEKRKYEKIINENSLNAALIPPQKNLNVYFKKANVCVLSSVNDPLPGFMLQSGLHVKPFIGSDVDGIAEVIENNVNGLLFKRRNEAELAERIEYFMENSAKARDCAENLNKLILTNFTEKTVIPEIESLYESFFK